MKIRNLLAPALLALTAVGQAFAGYLGPDNVVYDYKIINWTKSTVYQDSVYDLIAGVVTQDWHDELMIDIAGVVILGPTGLEDYSASKERREIDYDAALVWGGDWISNYYYHWKYLPEGGTYRWRSLTGLWSSPTPDGDTDPLSPGLDVAYPEEVTGTTVSGSGYITVVGDVPDPLVADISLSYTDSENYARVSHLAGTRNWAMITWTNIAPTSPPPPEDPEWAEEE